MNARTWSIGVLCATLFSSLALASPLQVMVNTSTAARSPLVGATSVSRNEGYSLSWGGREILVLDLSSGNSVATIPLEEFPQGSFLAHPSKDELYYGYSVPGYPKENFPADDCSAIGTSDTQFGVGIVNLATRMVVEHISLASAPLRFILAADQRTLFVSEQDGLQVVDLTTRSVAKTSGQGGGYWAYLNASQSKIFVAQYSGDIGVWDTLSLSWHVISPFSFQGDVWVPFDVASYSDPSHQRLFVEMKNQTGTIRRIGVIGMESEQIIALISTNNGSLWGGIIFSPDGSTAYLPTSGIVDLITYQQVGTLPVGGVAGTISNDGTTLFVRHFGGVEDAVLVWGGSHLYDFSVVDTVDWSTASYDLDSVPFTCSYQSLVAPSTDGRAMVMTNSAADSVSVVRPTLLGASLAIDPFVTAHSNGNGVLEPGEIVSFVPSWANQDTLSHSAQGRLTSFEGPGSGYGISDTWGSYSIDPLSQSQCLDCYTISLALPTQRPVHHWDAQILESSPTWGRRRWTVHIGESFDDVPPTYWAYKYVEALFHSGITAGCSQTDFCPDDQITRWQFAVFLAKGLEGVNLPTVGTVYGIGDYQCGSGGTSVFADVPPADGGCSAIHAIAARPITAGCGGGNFCPSEVLTRWQGAVLLARALTDPATIPVSGTVPGFGSYNCVVGGTSVFADVPPADNGCKYIHYVAAKGITVGCGGGNYCPDQPLSRAQMAVFITKSLHRTLGEVE